MTSASLKILTVIHWSDLFQLRLQAESLAKNWLGNKRWTIVIEDPHPDIAAANLEWCKQNIQMPNWNVDFVIPHSPNCLHNGWQRQQMFKMYYSATAEEDWVLVLDTKNFLIRPTGPGFFLRENNTLPYLPRFSDDDFFRLVTAHSKQVLGVTEDIPPAASMTPWIFNRQETHSLIQKLGINLEHWPVERATEFALYWHWTYHKFNWIPIQYVTGFWDASYSDSSPDDAMVQQIVAGAATESDQLFWTHHRYVTHPALRRVTKDVLKNAGLSATVIEQWNREFETLLSNTPARRHQEFIKNRQGDDPGFDKNWYK